MVVLNRIYTKTGDDGTTGLATGERVAKHHIRVAAYGTVDEANAFLGVARIELAGHPLDDTLARIQNDLFDLGADLATPEGRERAGSEPLRVIASQVAWLEAEIDRLNADLEPLRSFVLPAGSPAAAHLHVARTVVRRAERAVSELMEAEPEGVGRPALLYLNRLSDLLFVAARAVNGNGRADVLWVPGANR